MVKIIKETVFKERSGFFFKGEYQFLLQILFEDKEGNLDKTIMGISEEEFNRRNSSEEIWWKELN